MRKPYKLTFSITSQCNSKCRHCAIWKKEPTDELSTQEIGKILKSVKAPWVNLTGGEIFLREDLPKIAELIRENNGRIVNFATNSSLPDKIVENVKHLIGLFEKVVVTVSLDGPEELHDKIRGVKGSWNDAMEVYSRLTKLEKRNENFETYFGFTSFDENAGKMEKTVEEANKEIENVSKKDFHLNIYHASEHYYSNAGGKSSKLQKILKDVEFLRGGKKASGLVNFVENRYLKNLPEYLKTGDSPLPCQALNASCFINPKGDVYPCALWNKKLGNLRRREFKFSKIWNSKKAKNLRRQIGERECPQCWTPCEAYQTILGNILRIP